MADQFFASKLEGKDPALLRFSAKSSCTLVKVPELEAYMEKYSIRPTPAQEALHKEVEGHQFGGLNSTRGESHFLSWIVATIHARKAIEVGIFLGATTLAIAQELPVDGKLVALEMFNEFASVGAKFWKDAGVDTKIDLRIKPALESLTELVSDPAERSTYDFIYIDADKSNYDQYYELSLQLLRVGGVVAIDNIFWGGKVLENSGKKSKDTTTIRNLTAKISADSRVSVSIVPFADGVSLCRKL